MAAPELVIAESPFKTYPGGWIALPAVDYMAGARGTLSSEADARASNATGNVVRDTQKVSIAGPGGVDTDGFSDADDTLVIDLSALPLETNDSMTQGPSNPTLMYLVAASFLIEGDWNPSDPNSIQQTPQWAMWRSAALYAYGDYWSPIDVTLNADANYAIQAPRKQAQYQLVVFNSIIQVDLDDPDTQELRIKAFGLDGTTVEWLLDQIVLIPFQPKGVSGSPWDDDDFTNADGELPDFSAEESEGLWIDGAGGDEGDGSPLGKFTLRPYFSETEDNVTWALSGGGDYQKKADADDAEYSYVIRGDEDGDFYYIENSQLGFEVDPTVHMYGMHGAFWRPTLDWINDDFGRMSGSGNYAGTDEHFGPGGSANPWMGNTPEGFTWMPNGLYGPRDDVNGSGVRVGYTQYCDGSKGIMRCVREANLELSEDYQIAYLHGGDVAYHTADEIGARLDLDQFFSVSGKFAVTEQNAFVTSSGLASVGIANVSFGLSSTQGGFPFNFHNWFAFDVVTREFSYWEVNDTNTPIVDFGDIDISSWWVGAAEVGFRIELHRYRIRWRIWDASGAEPSTWDYEDFRRLPRTSPFGSLAYPYDAEPVGATPLRRCAWNNHRYSWAMIVNPGVAPGIDPEVLEVQWDDFVVTNDLLGDEEDISPTHYAIYQPHDGSKLYEIELPTGAQYFVYWGTRDWTELLPGDGPYIDFDLKAWSEPGAPPMQRADSYFFWLRSTHQGFRFVAMNWRSARRKSMNQRFHVD